MTTPLVLVATEVIRMEEDTAVVMVVTTVVDPAGMADTAVVDMRERRRKRTRSRVAAPCLERLVVWLSAQLVVP